MELNVITDQKPAILYNNLLKNLKSYVEPNKETKNSISCIATELKKLVVSDDDDDDAFNTDTDKVRFLSIYKSLKENEEIDLDDIKGYDNETLTLLCPFVNKDLVCDFYSYLRSNNYESKQNKVFIKKLKLDSSKYELLNYPKVLNLIIENELELQDILDDNENLLCFNKDISQEYLKSFKKTSISVLHLYSSFKVLKNDSKYFWLKSLSINRRRISLSFKIS